VRELASCNVQFLKLLTRRVISSSHVLKQAYSTCTPFPLQSFFPLTPQTSYFSNPPTRTYPRPPRIFYTSPIYSRTQTLLSSTPNIPKSPSPSQTQPPSQPSDLNKTRKLLVFLIGLGRMGWESVGWMNGGFAWIVWVVDGGL